jgi:TRAP-type C4-dicarboxylate transport system substrate-binding protein
MVFGVNSILKRIQAFREARKEKRVQAISKRTWKKFDKDARRMIREHTEEEARRKRYLEAEARKRKK